MEDQVQEAKDQKERNELLFWAAARGLLADAIELLAQGADPSAPDKHGLTPAHYAASQDHAPLLQYLATKGIDFEREDRRGRSPLHYAAAGGALEAVRFLVQRSPWLDAPDGADDTPLHLACRGGHTSASAALLAAGASQEARNERGLTPLGEAVAGGHVETVQVLVAAGGEELVKQQRANGYSLLHLAAGMGHARMAARLLAMGLDATDAWNEDGATPLHAAALAGSLECAELLLKSGASAAQESADGKLPEDLVGGADSAAGAAGGAAADAQERAAQVDALRRKLQAASKGRRVPAGGASSKPRAQQAAAAAAPASSASSNGAAGARSAPSPASNGTGNSSSSAPESHAQQFARLKPDEQDRRADALSRSDDSELSQLGFLSAPAREALGQLRRARHLAACYEAITALQADVEFREAASDPAVAAALEAARTTGSVPDRFVNDRAVMSVMGKMRKLQGVLRDNGGMRAGLADVLPPPGKAGEAARQLARQRLDEFGRAAAHWRARAVQEMGGRKAAAEAPDRQPAGAAAVSTNEIEACPEEPAGAPGRPGALGNGAPSGAAAGDPDDPMTYWERRMEEEAVLPWQTRIKKAFWESLQRSGTSLAMMLVAYAVMWFLGMLPGQQPLVESGQPGGTGAQAGHAEL